jgi:transposase
MQFLYYLRMRKSRLSKYKQNRLIELFVAGTTARTAAALVDVNLKTAIYYFDRLRTAIYLNDKSVEQLTGDIEELLAIRGIQASYASVRRW